MLTKADLKQIRAVVREEVEAEVKSVRSEIKFSTIRLETRFDEVEDRLKDVEINLNKVEKDLKEIKSEVRFIREALNATISHFEKDNIKFKKRVERIEDHLGFEPA